MKNICFPMLFLLLVFACKKRDISDPKFTCQKPLYSDSVVGYYFNLDTAWLDGNLLKIKTGNICAAHRVEDMEVVYTNMRMTPQPVYDLYVVDNALDDRLIDCNATEKYNICADFSELIMISNTRPVTFCVHTNTSKTFTLTAK